MIVGLLTQGDLLFPDFPALLAVGMGAACGAVDYGTAVDAAFKITPKAYQITHSVPASAAGSAIHP